MSTVNQYLEADIPFIPAVVCYFIKDNQVLLGLRKKVSLGLGENLISGIGGKVGDSDEIKHETHGDALLREVQEEIGVTVLTYENRGRVRFIWPKKSHWNQDVQIYIVTEWKGDPVETEVIKPMWFPIDALPKEQMWDDNSYWLPQVLSGKTVDAVLVIGEDNKVVEYTFY